MGCFDIAHLGLQLSKDQAVPLVAFSLNKKVGKDGKEHSRTYDEFDLADRLRSRGWILPAYKMAPNAQCGHPTSSHRDMGCSCATSIILHDTA